jgi:predicted double-glycine peptidase
MNIKKIFAQNGLVIQEESFTCGPCTLLNVLRLRGDPSHNEQELVRRCNAKPGIGTSHEDMVKVAPEIGLKLVKEKREATIEDIERHIDDDGAFVIVNYIDAFSGHGHYAIITEYDDKAFYFSDCSMGLFRLEKEFFKKFWHSASGIPQWYMAVK